MAESLIFRLRYRSAPVYSRDLSVELQSWCATDGCVACSINQLSKSRSKLVMVILPPAAHPSTIAAIGRFITLTLVSWCVGLFYPLQEIKDKCDYCDREGHNAHFPSA